VFLVMELLDGAPLHERAAAAGGKLGCEEVMLVADQLLDALAAAHAAGIVHRDIKPENVFVTKEGLVKILDFGIARVCEAQAKPLTTTRAGIPMGTPAFMAPEQARGRWDLVGPETDLWSLAATMFTLLSGELVHADGTVQELLAAAFTTPARSLGAVVPGLPEELVAVVDRGLRLELSERYPDAATMRADVQAAYATIFGRPLPEPVRPRASSAPRVTGRDLAPRTASTLATVETRVVARSPTKKHALVAAVGAIATGGAIFLARGSSAATMKAIARPALVSPVPTEAFIASAAGVPPEVVAKKPAPPPPARAPAGPTSKKSLFDRRF
jgi:serine/threonine-protein kinase